MFLCYCLRMKKVSFPNFITYEESPCKQCFARDGRPDKPPAADVTPVWIKCKLEMNDCGMNVESWAAQNGIEVKTEPM